VGGLSAKQIEWLARLLLTRVATLQQASELGHGALLSIDASASVRH